MKRKPEPAAERLRRSCRERQAFHRRSLTRRSRPRFHRDLGLIPHIFLSKERIRVAGLRRSYGEVLRALRGQAAWTLDTAARLACGRGLLTARDLIGYLTAETLRSAAEGGLVEEPRAQAIGVDPIVERPSILIVHLVEEPPPYGELPSGDRVVTWDLLVRDILGTLGWRADLLARLEGAYVAGGARPE